MILIEKKNVKYLFFNEGVYNLIRITSNNNNNNNVHILS